ncbi:MAG: hypothetical protein U0353_04645 [Sandaracinus sp.]
MALVCVVVSASLAASLVLSMTRVAAASSDGPCIAEAAEVSSGWAASGAASEDESRDDAEDEEESDDPEDDDAQDPLAFVDTARAVGGPRRIDGASATARRRWGAAGDERAGHPRLIERPPHA